MSGGRVAEIQTAPWGAGRMGKLPGFCVTGLAKGNKVILFVGTAPVGRDNMVYFIGGNHTPGLEAFFTKGMFGNIQVTDGSPAAAVNLVMFGGTVKLVIFTPGDSFMRRAVSAFPDCSRTAGVSAGF